MELKLNSYEIFELGEMIDSKLHENGITEKSVLTIYVNSEELNKIDEDLYYRNNPEGKDYIPSDGEIIVNFKNVVIKFLEKKEDK
jgi:hypothetical protein